MSVASFIANRLFHRQTTGGQVSRPAVVVASLGVAVGVAVMLASVGIVLGFKHEIRSKVLAMQGDIQVLNYRSLTSQESYPVLIDDSVVEAVRSCPGVTGCERFVSKPGMLKSADAFHGIQLMGTEGGDTAFIPSRMLADAMQIGTGSRINAYFFENTIRARRFTVDSLYSTNMEQFDNRIVLAGYDTVHRLTGWGRDECSGMRIFIDSGMDAGEVAYDLSRRLSPYSLDREYVVLTAEELSPQVFAWLSLLDTNVWIILVLMLCVASFTMVSGLLILILERTFLVALLKSIGATDRLVRHVFVHLAARLMLRAMFWGNVVGLGLLWVQKCWGVVHLDASEYYLDTVPVLFNWPYFIAVNVGTFVIATMTLLFPALFVARIHPAEAMRIE